MEVRRQS